MKKIKKIVAPFLLATALFPRVSAESESLSLTNIVAGNPSGVANLHYSSDQNVTTGFDIGLDAITSLPNSLNQSAIYGFSGSYRTGETHVPNETYSTVFGLGYKGSVTENLGNKLSVEFLQNPLEPQRGFTLVERLPNWMPLNTHTILPGKTSEIELSPLVPGTYSPAAPYRYLEVRPINVEEGETYPIVLEPVETEPQKVRVYNAIQNGEIATVEGSASLTLPDWNSSGVVPVSTNGVNVIYENLAPSLPIQYYRARLD